MVVFLDNRTLEASLPDMPNALVISVVMPGVSHAQRLENTADRLARLRAEQQVEMVGHEAVAVEAKRIAFFRFPQGLEEGEIIVSPEENVSTVVSAVDRVIQQTIRHGSRSTRHGFKVKARHSRGQEEK